MVTSKHRMDGTDRCDAQLELVLTWVVVSESWFVQCASESESHRYKYSVLLIHFFWKRRAMS